MAILRLRPNRERPSTQVWLSVAGSVVGVALMELSGQSDHLETPPLERWLAIAGMFVASLATAVAMLGLHRLRHIHPWAIVAHFSGVALLFSVASFFVSADAPASSNPPRPETLLLLLSVGVTATIGQLFLTKAFSAGPPAKVSVVSLTQIVFVMVLEIAFWDRRFNVLTLAGMVLVMAPTAWLMASQTKGERPA